MKVLIGVMEYLLKGEVELIVTTSTPRGHGQPDKITTEIRPLKPHEVGKTVEELNRTGNNAKN